MREDALRLVSLILDTCRRQIEQMNKFLFEKQYNYIDYIAGVGGGVLVGNGLYLIGFLVVLVCAIISIAADYYESNF